MADGDSWQKAIEPGSTAFFLDVDGTLLGFKDRPEDVVADADLIELLRGLVACAGGAVAFVSGRSLVDLDRIAAPLILPAGAVHGADLRFADGRRETADAAALDEVRRRARAFIEERPGLRLEDKGATLAVHFRAAPDRGDEVLRFLEAALEGHDLVIQPGKMVAEVKSGRSDKGTAIREFMAVAPFSGRTPLFIGDDQTDERGFDAVNSLCGISIKVGSIEERTIASHRLADESDVRKFLRLICRSALENGEKAIS